MKFKDLEFEDHAIAKEAPANFSCAKQARHDFPNGYGVSVITGMSFYTSHDNPYELAVFHNGSLCYDTPLTDDVIGYLTKTGVSRLLTKIEALPPIETDND